MAGFKERLIQFILRGRDELSPAAKQSTEAVEDLKEATVGLNQALDSAKDARGLVNGLGNTKRSIEQTEATISRVNGSIVDLRDALDKNPDSVGLAQSLKEAEREASRLNRGLDRLKVQLADQEKAAQAAGIDTSNLAGEEKRLAEEIDKTKAAIAENSQRLRELQREQARAGVSATEHADRVSSMREVLGSATRQVLAFGAAYLTIDAAMGVFRTGLNLVRDGLRAVAADGAEKEQALAQLEAALASTGNAAGLTAEQLLEMADSFEASSLLSAEQVQAAQTRLLSYTDVAGKEFPRAMQLVIDQQQRLGISVEQSAEIVGRALQSPSEAITTLGRQGFKLEDGQKRLLKQLEATGKKAEAQAIIMDMLTEAYGGAAAAARMNTFQGLLKGIGDRFGDFASRVANSGAFEYMRTKLKEFSDYLDVMANDGRLDRLAKAISDVFVQGAQSAERYIKKLGEIDFEGLAARAGEMVTKIGPAMESLTDVTRYTVATMTTGWNAFTILVNSGAAFLVKAVQQTLGRLALAGGQIAGFFGASDVRAKAEGMYTFLGELSDAYAQQAVTDLDQIAKAWDFSSRQTKTKAKEQTEAVTEEVQTQAEFVLKSITDIGSALEQVSAAGTVAQLRQVGDAMREAYQKGNLSQQEYSAGLVELNKRLRDMGGAASSTGSTVKGLAGDLKTLTDVQGAIASARTDRDITAISAALRKMYDTGVISASEYNAEVARLAEKQRELKAAVDASKKSQDAKNESDREAIKTSEELRRESGRRMEAERRAGDQAMQDRRRGAAEARKDMGAVEDFYGGVMTRAREPLAQLSEAALEAFDKLQGITTVDLSLDTSGLEATTLSLRRATEALGQMETAANTMGMSGWGRFMTESLVRSQRLQVQYLQEKQALQQLMEGYENGSLSARDFAQQAEQTRNSVRLLNDSDLRTLESAIDSAKDRMRELGESSQQTLSSLQDELDQLQGNQEEIERRRFAGRRRELESQLVEAQQSGDPQAMANLQRSLSLLRQIEAETAAQSERAAQQKRIDEVKAATPTPAPVAPTKVIRLEDARGRAVDVSVATGQDESNLIGILEDAALRSR